MSTAKGVAEVIAALLARAYVSGDLDVEGDLTDGLRRVHATAPAPARSA